MFALLYGKFTQENTHQILLWLAGFHLRYDKNILVFFVHSVYKWTRANTAEIHNYKNTWQVSITTEEGLWLSSRHWKQLWEL